MVKIAHDLDEDVAAAAPAGRIVVLELGRDGLLAVAVRPASGESLLARAAEPRTFNRMPPSADE